MMNVVDIADRLYGAAKNNPEGFLVLAAGCALLMRHRSLFGPSSQPGDRQEWQPAGRPPGSSGSGAGEFLRDATAGVRDTASSYASNATRFAADAGRIVTERSGELARQAQTTLSKGVGRITQSQPFLVAALGLAAGAAVAAVFPATELERRSLRPAGETLSRVAAPERLTAAAVAAGHRLLDAAEHGLGTDDNSPGGGRSSGSVGQSAGERASASGGTGPVRPQ
jgi:hypothetical protein